MRPKGIDPDETITQKIARVANRQPVCATWIFFFNVLIVVLSLLLAPFTTFASLLFLLVIPFDAALASIATSSYQQRNLTKLHLTLIHQDNESKEQT